MSESWDEFLSSLGPKLAREMKTGDSVEKVIYPTASLQLNNALGGGIGTNRITTIYGNYSSGKSMLVLQTIATLQKQGLVCGYVDVEGTFSRDYAEALGVDVSRLVLSQKRTGAQVENDVTNWMKAGMNFVGIDSISAIMPDVFVDDKTGELKGADDRGQIGAHARTIKRLIKGILYHLTDDCAVVMVSQVTTEFGQTYTKQIPEGGKALPFNSTQVIRLQSSERDAEQIKGFVPRGDVEIEMPIGRHVEATVVKNKLTGRQNVKCKYDIYYGGDQIGIDNIAELIDLAVDYDIVSKGGAWFNYGDLKWQGRLKMIEHFKEEPDLYEEIKSKLEELI